jgi:hypothetical protein
MKPKMASNTASVAVIGVEIGKEVFHLVELGADGRIAFRRTIRRAWVSETSSKSCRRASSAWKRMSICACRLSPLRRDRRSKAVALRVDQRLGVPRSPNFEATIDMLRAVRQFG